DGVGVGGWVRAATPPLLEGLGIRAAPPVHVSCPAFEAISGPRVSLLCLSKPRRDDVMKDCAGAFVPVFKCLEKTEFLPEGVAAPSGGTEMLVVVPLRTLLKKLPA